jgi:large repetitive protein
MGVARFGMDELFSFAFSSYLIMDVSQPQCTSQMSIRNSIIAGDHAPTGPDISGRLTSDGYNLIQDTSGASFTPNKQHLTDILGNKFPNLGIDPLLQDNGGLAKPHTFTHALLLGSPANDTIPLEACHVNGITTDQRGVKRPDGHENTCDIGAYEYIDKPT